MRPEGAAAGANTAATKDRAWFHNRGALLLLPLLALFLVHPLIVHGCSCGHDFDFHLLSWFEAATQISHRNLHPHWAFTPAWDAGEPRFVFYPPLSWYLGAFLGLALTHLPGLSEAAAWTAAPIVFTWIALTLSGLTMFRLARTFASTNPAFLVAAIYMANPYMLFTAYERTAYAELLAAAWIPLLLEGILRERITVPRIAIPIALLWLTNAPAAVMGCYALALLAIPRLLMPARWNFHQNTPRPAFSYDASRILAGALLGLALAAFYILPAAYERRYVQAAMATIGGMRIDANFLFNHTGNTPDDLLHDQVLRTASWIAVLLLAATVIALIAAWSRTRAHTSTRPLPIASLAIFTAVIALLLTPLSAPIWRYLPEMPFLQFPWRLLALLAAVLALAIAVSLPDRAVAGSITRKPSTHAVLAALLVAAALGLSAWHIFRQPCDPEDTAPARIALFHSNAGTDPTDEYTPATADNDALQPGDPAWWLADSATAASPPQTAATTPRTAPMRLAIDAPHAEFLILNLRSFPAWHITLAHNNASQPITERDARSDGLIAVPVPSGQSTISIEYAQSPDQEIGDVISCFALVLLVLVLSRGRSRTPLAVAAA